MLLRMRMYCTNLTTSYEKRVCIVKFFIKKMNTPMVTGCVDLNSIYLEFDMKLEIQSSSSKEVWDGILSAIHIFNPSVVNRIVDSQDVEDLK